MPASADAEDRPDRAAYAELEEAVNRALQELEGRRKAAEAASARVAELEKLLSGFAEGKSDPAALDRRSRELESENAELLSRMEEARGVVERLQARIRFLEENG